MSTPDLEDERRHAYRVIAGYLSRYRTLLTLGAMCLVVTDFLLLANPWILKITIDELQTGITRERLGTLAILFVGVSLVSGVFRFLMRRVIIGVSRHIELDIRADFFAHLESLSPSFYNRHRTGDLMALATNDLNAVRSLVGPGVMYSMNTVVMGGLALVLMVILSWKLTIVALLPMGILALGMYHSMKLIHRYFEKVQERFGSLNSRAQENLSGMRVIRAYAREHHEIEEYDRLSQTYLHANIRLFRVQSLLQPLLTSVAGLGGLFILGYGGKQVIDGTITLGTFVAFTGYLTMLVWPTIALGWVMNIIERGLASMQRINRVLDAKPDIIDHANADASMPDDCTIAFEDVSFSYHPETGREDVLKHVSFRVNDGETVAITGATGAGKSTLVSLVLRLYEPQNGSISIGGVPVEDLPLGELRSRVALVPQDIFLFSESIRDNVGFGVTTLSDTVLAEVTRTAAIDEEVASFPHQYETMVGERGINLSGGQKQRLAIARALAKDPHILILDDALSSVDTDTEERILSTLRDEIRSRTAIIISHRISTVREADRILVLDDGRLVEEGSHEELVALGGLYAEMNRKQQLMYNLERD